MEKAIGEVRLALTTRATAENDDDDKEDWDSHAKQALRARLRSVLSLRDALADISQLARTLLARGFPRQSVG